jgi:type IV fimbrial biogenesis protein FimT
MDITNRLLPAQQQGISALELLTTLSASLVLATAGIPAVQTLSTSSHMTSAINGVVSQLHLARSAAITRNARAVLCPSSDGQSCLDSFEWQQGFILFLDDNENEQREGDEEILGTHQPKPGPIRIVTTTGRRFIRYMPEGMAGFSNATFTFCDKQNKLAPKAAIISPTGRVRVSTKEVDADRCA